MNAKKALAVLLAAFRSADVPAETLRLYERKLADIPGPLLERTVHRIVETVRFFPSIAEVRETAASLAGLLPPPAAEALALMRKADVEFPVYRRDGSFAYMERVWEWPPDAPPALVRCAEKALARTGDPVRGDGGRVFAWEQQFREAYERVAEEQTAIALGDLSHAALPSPGRKAVTAGRRPWAETGAVQALPPGGGEGEPVPIKDILAGLPWMQPR